MPSFKKAADKIRHGLLLKWIFDRLASIGLEIVPYYWVREHYVDPMPDGLTEEDFKDFTLVELTKDDMARVAMDSGDRIADRKKLEEKIATPGINCLALVTPDNDIACFTWADLRAEPDVYYKRKFAPNEAYLFDMYTMKPYRGRNLALYLRLQIMKRLMRHGVDTFYSISEAFNTPTRRFKSKLNAEELELNVQVKLFFRYSWKWRVS